MANSPKPSNMDVLDFNNHLNQMLDKVSKEQKSFFSLETLIASLRENGIYAIKIYYRIKRKSIYTMH